MYPTKRTPVQRDAPPHMSAIPRIRTHSTGPVGSTPVAERPQSRRDGRGPPVSSQSSPTLGNRSSHPQGSPDLANPFGPPRGTMLADRAQPPTLHSPLQPILESSH